MRKLFTLSAFSVMAIALLSAIAAAVIIAYPEWSNHLQTITIDNGEVASFNVSLISNNPPISYTVSLIDFATQQRVSTVQTGTLNGNNQYITVDVDSNAYMHRGGSYIVRIDAQDSDLMAYDEQLRLNVVNYAPFFMDPLPDVTMDQYSTYVIDLNDYVFDYDDKPDTWTWDVTGNSIVDVSITDGVATITSSNDAGTDILIFTVSDPTGDSASASMAVTVNSESAPVPAREKVDIRNVEVKSIGDGYIKIRNTGSRMEGLSVRVRIENANAPLNIFTMDLDGNRVVYKPLDTEGLEPGIYLARVQISSDDFDESGYLLVEI